jgi:thymidylate kinase
MKILKKLILLVEGPDGVGKTTICKKLSYGLELPVVKMVKAKVYFKKNVVEEFSFVFNNTLLQLKDLNYIVDRGPLSSLIYSKIYNRKSELAYLYPLLREMDPLVIYLTSSSSTVLLERREKDKVIAPVDRIKVWQGYEEFFKTQQFVKALRIDTNRKTPVQIYDEIIEYLKKNKYIE